MFVIGEQKIECNIINLRGFGNFHEGKGGKRSEPFWGKAGMSVVRIFVVTMTRAWNSIHNFIKSSSVSHNLIDPSTVISPAGILSRYAWES